MPFLLLIPCPLLIHFVVQFARLSFRVLPCSKLIALVFEALIYDMVYELNLCDNFEPAEKWKKNSSQVDDELVRQRTEINITRNVNHIETVREIEKRRRQNNKKRKS